MQRAIYDTFEKTKYHNSKYVITPDQSSASAFYTNAAFKLLQITALYKGCESGELSEVKPSNEAKGRKDVRPALESSVPLYPGNVPLPLLYGSRKIRESFEGTVSNILRGLAGRDVPDPAAGLPEGGRAKVMGEGEAGVIPRGHERLLHRGPAENGRSVVSFVVAEQILQRDKRGEDRAERDHRRWIHGQVPRYSRCFPEHPDSVAAVHTRGLPPTGLL